MEELEPNSNSNSTSDSAHLISSPETSSGGQAAGAVEAADQQRRLHPSLSRSRSRGRSKPGELLARKQQILNNQQMNSSLTTSSNTNTNKQDTSSSSNTHYHKFTHQQQQDLESLIANQELEQLSGDSASWSLSAAHSNNSNNNNNKNSYPRHQLDLNHQHRRSLTRRAKLIEQNQEQHQQQQKQLSRSSTNGTNHLHQHNSQRHQHDTNNLTSSDNRLDDARAKSVEAKLESLSEMLKDHQLMSNSNSSSNGLVSFANNTNQINNSENLPSSTTTPKSIDDVYILLAKKEKDLQLAAELGKVLLEKNDELSKANERITEDYSHKLELLEQDKHKLKRKLDLLDGEYENRLIELQTDCNILKNQLDEQQQLKRQAEKEKSKLIDDLVQQNQRLTSELVEATKSEELLSSQLEQLNERFNVRMSNRQDHVVQLEALKEEIQIVNQRKQDLERRLKLAQNDKAQLSATLDESGDKILLLENLLNEKENKLAELLEETNELRDSSCWLSNELESMISLNEKLATNISTADIDEQLDRSGEDDDDDDYLTTGDNNYNGQLLLRKRSRLVEQLRLMRQKHQSRMKANQFMLSSKRQTLAANAAAAGKVAAGAGQVASASRRKRGRHGAKARDASLFDELESHHSGSNNNRSQEEEEASEVEDDDDDLLDQDSNETSGSSRRSAVGGGTDDGARTTHAGASWRDESVLEIFVLLNRYQATLQRYKDKFSAQQQTTSSVSQTQHQPASPDDSKHLLLSVGGQAGAATSGQQQQQLQHNAQQQQQQHLYSPNSTDDSGISSDDIEKAGSSSVAPDERLLEAAKDPESWRRLLVALKSLIDEMPCSTCQLMISERADYEQLQKLHSRLSDELRRKNEQLLSLNVSQTEQETKLAALEEKCAILSDDLSNCDKPKEEIVKLAWKARDDAVERKNKAEICLAKTRIENMQISSQLMEVVQQKGELSQKLAQFEDDIHYMTQDSVKAKFTWQEYAENMRRSKQQQHSASKQKQNNKQQQSTAAAAAKVVTDWTHQRLSSIHYSTSSSSASGLATSGNNNTDESGSSGNTNNSSSSSNNPTSLAYLLGFSSLVSVAGGGGGSTPAGGATTTTSAQQPSSNVNGFKGENGNNSNNTSNGKQASCSLSDDGNSSSGSGSSQQLEQENSTANNNNNITATGSTQPASLMRNLTSNRFNLKFWQRSPTTTATATEASENKCQQQQQQQLSAQENATEQENRT